MKKIWNKIQFKWRWFWMCKHDRAFYDQMVHGFSFFEGDKRIDPKDIYKREA